MGSRSLHFAWILAAAGALGGCGSSTGKGTPDGGGPAGGDGGGVVAGDGGGGNGNDLSVIIPEGPTEFFTSFETGDPQPTYLSTVETDSDGHKKASGVSGPTNGGFLGSIMDSVAAITASGENPPSEIAVNLGDGDTTTKWLTFAGSGWVRLQLLQPIAVRRYALASANDHSERDPKAWTFEGSQDGSSWTVLDTRSGESFDQRYQMKQYDFANTTAYLYYRVNVSQVQSGSTLQLSEILLSNGDDTPPAQSDMKSLIGRGPGGSYNAKLSAGFTGVRAFRFAGAVTASGRGYSFNKMFDVDVVVRPESQLSYLIFPDETPQDPSYPSTFAAVDLAFDDGTYLSDLGALDQSFATVSPSAQGASRTLIPGEWNQKLVALGAVAAGKRVKRILVGYDNPNGPVASFGGWLDDLRITAQVQPAPSHLSDWVLTTRGTLSSSDYSRGNCFPATAVPHGFNFWTPATDAGSNSWMYVYHRDNNEQNLPLLQSLNLSHEPSPWMGARQMFQVMPSSATGAPSADRAARALAFRHEREIARPYYYSVTTESGIRAELAPTDHAAIFRFTFPSDDANLIFDNIDNNGGLTLDAAGGTLSGWSDARSGLSTGATRLFVYATFDRPVAASAKLSGGGGNNVAGYFRFAADASHRVVTMRIASSLISVDQAKANLLSEIAPAETFESVEARAQALWDQKLGIVEVEGASDDQRVTLYSNLYRLFLYPSSAFENTGTADQPVYQYASPFQAATGSSTATQTGAAIVTGKLYVNNGFWDTYRATWPAYALFTPTEAGDLVNGFVQQYRDGGWIARWSAPGYADLMTGTSSDVAFADAYLKGVTNFDVRSAYDAAVRNATVRSPSSGVGRKGLETSIFLGYTNNATGAGLSWAMAGYLNDFGIGNLAAQLAQANPSDPRHQEFSENAEYFLARAQGYANLFDPSIGFFQGRKPDGSFALTAGSYDPRVWGGDYTETDGWNTAFDAPFDGQGLANLYGGKAKLAAKLDEFFATPERANFPGGYGGVIHEMREARDVRLGQLGLSNQPSFHILYMYDVAGQPAKTQALVREALARLFTGSALGQGYLGDEDNGAMAAWHIFGALGFYPLAVGSPYYVIGSPLFTKATVHLENGKRIVVNAPGNSGQNVYVQSLKVNGAAYSHTYLSHATLAAGATLDFELGPHPSAWGTGSEDAPPSLTSGSALPKPLKDAAVAGAGSLSASDGSNVSALLDDSSLTQASFGAGASLTYHFSTGAPTVSFYTLTSASSDSDPTAWTLQGSNDGASWTNLDARAGQRWTWRQQTRPFQIAKPASYAYYRLVFTGPAGATLSELELLTR